MIIITFYTDKTYTETLSCETAGPVSRIDYEGTPLISFKNKNGNTEYVLASRIILIRSKDLKQPVLYVTGYGDHGGEKTIKVDGVICGASDPEDITDEEREDISKEDFTPEFVTFQLPDGPYISFLAASLIRIEEPQNREEA